MATTLDQTIAQRQHNWISGIVSSQTFWVLISVILACIFLSFATDSVATAKNLYNITRNVTETYIEDVQTNDLTRYFMLTFTYNLRNFGTKGKG